MGSYIPLEDRKAGSSSDIGGESNGGNSSAPIPISGIYKKVEIEMVSQEGLAISEARRL